MHMHIRTYPHAHTHMDIYKNKDIHIHTHTDIYIHTHIDTRIQQTNTLESEEFERHRRIIKSAPQVVTLPHSRRGHNVIDVLICRAYSPAHRRRQCGNN